jgi:uncharacterized membrane protein
VQKSKKENTLFSWFFVGSVVIVWVVPLLFVTNDLESSVAGFVLFFTAFQLRPQTSQLNTMDEVVSTIWTYVKVLVVYLVVDVIYLVLPPVSAYNKSVIEGVQGSPVELRLVPALLVYFVGAAALTWILVHAPEGRRVASAAFMGFCTYGTPSSSHLFKAQSSDHDVFSTRCVHQASTTSPTTRR